MERPPAAKPCSTCGELVGRGYPDCATCADSIDALWSADWHALMFAERVRAGTDAELELAERVLADDLGSHPWTCTDWALWLLACEDCGGRLGSGEPGCVACAAADAARWAWDHTGMPHSMTDNEHALRVAVAILRAPHRHREPVLACSRLVLPFLLAGELPTASVARRIRALVLAGRYAELAVQDSLADMVHLPDLPWRVRGGVPS